MSLPKSVDARVQFVDRSLFGPLIERAKASARLRTNHNFHAGNEDNPHRFLNVMARGTYIPPHRHISPPKSETFLILEGRVALFTFDEAGTIELAEVIGGPERMGGDVPAGVWHTLAVLTEYAVSFEVKPGPYVGPTDKDLPAWAIDEGQPGSGEYLEWLLRQLPDRG
jgi:cupin fold WbuC family metalloprotein